MGKKPAAQSVAKATEAKEAKKETKKEEPVKAKKSPSHSHASSVSRESNHCKIKGCKRAYRAKGYCSPHYREWRHGKFGVARYKICKDGECRKPMSMNRHGYCEDHFQNYYVKGASKPAVAPAEKPAEKVAEKATA